MRKQSRVMTEGWADKVQLALDAAGLVPGIGEIADAINALISLGRGDPLGAALSAISMVPGAGDAVGKGGKVVIKILEPAMPVIKMLGSGKPVKELVAKLGPEVIEGLAKHSDKIIALKDFVAKHGKAVGDLLDTVKKGNTEEVMEKIFKSLGKEAPKLEGEVKKIADFTVKKVSEAMPDTKQLLADFYDFLAELTEEKFEEFKKGTSDKDKEDSEKKAVDENFLHERYSIRRVMMTDEMINDALRELAMSYRRS